MMRYRVESATLPRILSKHLREALKITGISENVKPGTPKPRRAGFDLEPPDFAVSSMMRNAREAFLIVPRLLDTRHVNTVRN